MRNLRKLTGAGLAFGAAVIALCVTTPAAQADVVPEHAVVVCQTATFYQNFNHATNAPDTPLWTLDYGRKVGHTPGSQPVYSGWASTFDFGDGSWGYMLDSCIGGYDSW
jgi:opacity protein-like surface antigen